MANIPRDNSGLKRKLKGVKKVTPRIEAAMKGEYTYYTGVACKRGHLSERYTKNANCIECGQYHQRRYTKIVNKLIKDMREKENKPK